MVLHQQLTKSFIEKVIKEPVSTFSTSEGSKKGDNVAGTILAIKVKTESGKALDIVHKAIPPGPMEKMFAVGQQTFRIENAFYSYLAPALENWAKSKDFKVANRIGSVLPIPKFYEGFNDDENDYLCMEDLRPKGYRMADKFIGLNFEETSLVLKEVAQYHAIAYGFLQWEGHKVFDKQEFKIFNKDMFDDNNGMLKQGMEMFKGTYQNSVELIQSKDPSLAEKIEKRSPKRLNDLFSTALGTDKKYFPVIILGDLWVNNILFKYSENGSPEDVKFIDFQLTRRGNIFDELHYFIFTSTTPEFRKNHLSLVLDVYYNSFLSTVDALKIHPPINFTRGFFIDSFFENYFSTFVYLSFAIPMQLGTPMDFSPPAPGGANDVFTPEQGTPQQIPLLESSQTTDQPPPAGFDEFQTKMMVGGLRYSMESSPRALIRLFDIATEMNELKVF